MTPQQEILTRMNILFCQIAESIESGEMELGYVRQSTDEIQKLIDELNRPLLLSKSVQK